MDNVVDFKKIKEEENISFVVDMIIDNIVLNLEDRLEYKTNFFITGYNKQMNTIVNKINELALKNKIEVEIILQPVPTSSTNIIIKSFKSDDMFMRYIRIEKDLYNKIINDNKSVFDNNEIKINTLYVLHALQTAIYHAGYDNVKINVNDKFYNLKASNKIKKYMSKVVLIDMLKYYQKIENERQDNINKRILTR